MPDHICLKCHRPIPEGRLKAIPGVLTCLQCSSTEKVRGFRIITGKTTYTELQLVSTDTYQKLTAKQARIGMSPGRGIWMDKK